jgi:hypothetical protein
VWWDSLEAEPYERVATMFEWSTGKSWLMPDAKWLLDECADFIVAGKLADWLAYYNNFEGME